MFGRSVPTFWLVLLASLAIAACSRKSPEAEQPAASTTPPAAPEPAAAPDDLNGSEWTLESFRADEAVPAGVQITLAVENNTVSGTSGCNRYTGSFATDPSGNITLGPLAGTRMACPPPQQDAEDRYLQALQHATSWRIEDGRLSIAYRQDDAEHLLTYRAAIASQSTD